VIRQRGKTLDKADSGIGKLGKLKEGWLDKNLIPHTKLTTVGAGLFCSRRGYVGLNLKKREHGSMYKLKRRKYRNKEWEI
jgi:hypothetical protein